MLGSLTEGLSEVSRFLIFYRRLRGCKPANRFDYVPRERSLALRTPIVNRPPSARIGIAAVSMPIPARVAELNRV